MQPIQRIQPMQSIQAMLLPRVTRPFFSVSPLVTRMRADSPDFSLDVSPGTAWNAKRFKRLPSSFVETDAASSSSVGGAMVSNRQEVRVARGRRRHGRRPQTERTTCGV